jgi:uncharacterized membrane protein YoaK (UPF0700 family)
MASGGKKAPPGPAKVVASMNDLPRREFWTVVTAGFLLAINAGFINASTMVGLFGTTVSHVTGTLTRIGVKSVQGEFDIVLRETCILLGFTFGAFVGGIILRNSKFKFTRRYGAALLAESFMLYMTALAIWANSYVAPVLGAFCCGLQNAVGTVYSAAILRTTHVTGTATDIGMILGQNLAVDTHHDLWKLYVLTPLMVGYFIGSVLGCSVYQQVDYVAFIFPATFVGIIGIVQLLLIQFKIVKYQRISKERYEALRRARRAATIGAQVPLQLQGILDDRNRRSETALPANGAAGPGASGGVTAAAAGVGVGAGLAGVSATARRGASMSGGSGVGVGEMIPMEDLSMPELGDRSRDPLLVAPVPLAGESPSGDVGAAVSSPAPPDVPTSVRV